MGFGQRPNTTFFAPLRLCVKNRFSAKKESKSGRSIVLCYFFPAERQLCPAGLRKMGRRGTPPSDSFTTAGTCAFTRKLLNQFLARSNLAGL